MIQLLPVMVAVLTMDQPTEEVKMDKPIPRAELVSALAAMLLPQILLLGSAATLFLRAARTRRWKLASWALLGTMVGEILFGAVAIATLGPEFIPDRGQPPITRLALGVVDVLSILEMWWIAVIIGEFAASCRETVLLGQSENLGYGILAAIGILIAWIGWTLPLPGGSQDDFTQFLQAAAMISQLVIFFWMLQPLTRAFAVATILVRRIDEIAKNPPAETQAGV